MLCKSGKVLEIHTLRALKFSLYILPVSYLPPRCCYFSTCAHIFLAMFRFTLRWTRLYIFERLLSYVFNQINNFIMVLLEIVGQENKNPRIRDLVAKSSRIRDAKKHKKTRFRDSFKLPPQNSRPEQKFPRPLVFRVPFATPSSGWLSRNLTPCSFVILKYLFHRMPYCKPCITVPDNEKKT